MIKSLFYHGTRVPFATNLPLISVPIGLLALVIGPDISRGFTNVFHRPEPVYVWGVVMLLGGLQVARGIGSRHPSKERAGLYILALAYAFYGLFVMVGLGRSGLVTGPLTVTLALCCVLRARVILAAAKLLASTMDTPPRQV